MISISEIFNLIILTVAIGYIFSGFIKKPGGVYKPGFNWEDFKFSIIVAARAVVLHELFHKFVAILFGMSAQFYIWPFGIFLAVFLKLIHSPFLIIAPGYVGIPGLQQASMITAIIAFAGPLANIILFTAAHLILTRAKHLTRIQATALYLTKQINLLLLIFNLIPIPPLDGSKVLAGIISLF